MYAYFDETEGSTNRELIAVAGYLFDERGRDHFVERYRTFVEPLIPPDSQGRRIFHAAACLAGDDHYFRTPRPIREAILQRMATVISESATVAAVVGVERQEYQLALKGRYMRVEIQGVPVADGLTSWMSSQYTTCLVRCIDGLNQWLDKEPSVGPLAIEYVVEKGARHEREALTVLARVAENANLRSRYRFGSYSFRAKSPDEPLLFPPDYYAWEFQRYHRFITGGVTDSDERTYLKSAVVAKPHLSALLGEAALNVQAMINAFYGLMPLDRPPLVSAPAPSSVNPE